MTTTSASPSLPAEDSHMVPGERWGGWATEETPSCHKPCTAANLSKRPSLPTCPLSRKRKLEAESGESAACQHQGSGRNVWFPLLANSIFRKRGTQPLFLNFGLR